MHITTIDVFSAPLEEIQNELYFELKSYFCDTMDTG